MSRKRSKGDDCACKKNCKMVTISHVEQLIMRKRGVMVRMKERGTRKRRYVIRECQRTILVVEDALRGDRPSTFNEVCISIAGKVITGYGVGDFSGFDNPEPSK